MSAREQKFGSEEAEVLEMRLPGFSFEFQSRCRTASTSILYTSTCSRLSITSIPVLVQYTVVSTCTVQLLQGKAIQKVLYEY